LIKAAVLGATGMVGQRLIKFLEGHPWFQVASVAASEKRIGKKYGETAAWLLLGEIPEAVAELPVCSIDPKSVGDVDLVFSTLPSEVAGEVEESFAKAGYVVLSDAASHRMEPDVPILIPEVNAEHIALIDEQKKNRKWDGAIVTNPNCTAVGLVMSLKPIFDNFGISRVILSTMQALSGAGYPGVASLDIADNVIPYIRREEEKVEAETLKMLGSTHKPAEIKVSASCHRVNVTDGHLEAVFLETGKQTKPEDVAEAMRSFRGEPQRLGLPSAPKHPIVVRGEPDRPQPKLDRMEERGMTVVAGRIRRDPVFNGIKYLVLSHNTVRGAGGNSTLNAELLKAKGYL